MVFLGLILAAAAAAVGVGVLLDNNVPVTISAYGQGVSGFTEREVFVGGMAIASLFLLGWILIVSGIRRRRKLRGDLDELEDLRENREAYIQSLENERTRLTRELEEARKRSGGVGSPAGAGVGAAAGGTTAGGAARSGGLSDMPGMQGDAFGDGPLRDDLGVRVASSDSSFFRPSR